MISWRKLQQKGDTILEVMICVAVIGLILTAAFGLARRNTTTGLQSQERAEAQKIAETQLERLRSYADLLSLPDVNSNFCTVSDNSQPTGVRIVPFTSSPQGNTFSDPEGNYPNACKEGFFRFTIWSPGKVSQIGGVAGKPYGVTVRWDSAGNVGTEEVKMFYTLYDSTNPNFGVGGAATPACSDQRDNDNDGKVDFPADPGCTSTTDTSEVDPQCLDGIDNDGDGKVDLNDPGCYGNPQLDHESPDPPIVREVNGRDHSNCYTFQTYACVDEGTSTYGCDSYGAIYPIANVPTAKYSLTLNYNDRLCSFIGGTIPGPPNYTGYKFDVKIYVAGNLIAEKWLDPQGGSVTVDAGTISTPNPAIKIEWLNNQFVANGSNPWGYDPNFQINKIKLTEYQ